MNFEAQLKVAKYIFKSNIMRLGSEILHREQIVRLRLANKCPNPKDQKYK